MTELEKNHYEKLAKYYNAKTKTHKEIFEKEPEDYPIEERNCECCVNHTEEGCKVWDCHFESAY